MPWKYRCSCGRTLAVPTNSQAKSLRCPACQEPIRLEDDTRAIAAETGSHAPPPPKKSTTPPPSPTLSSARLPTSDPPPVEAVQLQSGQVVGYQPDLGKRELAMAVAIALMLTAVVGCMPVIWEWKEHLQAAFSPGVSRWTYGVLFITLLQIVYAVYLMQLPDWSSLWMVTAMLLMVAAAYALLLGMTLARNPDGTLVRMLDLTDHLTSGRATTWCLIMLTITALLAVATGRFATDWRRDVLMREE